MVGLDEKALKPTWALEIKWSDRYFSRPHELKSLLRFCSDNQLTEAIVTTISIQESVEHDGMMLHFVPAAVYAYAVGANTLS